MDKRTVKRCIDFLEKVRLEHECGEIRFVLACLKMELEKNSIHGDSFKEWWKSKKSNNSKKKKRK